MRRGRFFAIVVIVVVRISAAVIVIIVIIVVSAAYTAAAAILPPPVPLPSVVHAAKPRVQIIAAITAKTVKNSLFFIFRLLKNKVKIFYHSIR